jgi:hypothetical protein
MSHTAEPLAELLRRYHDPAEEPAEVTRISLTAALQRGDDPMHIIEYLNGLGITVSTLDDLLAINDDQTEEELHSFRVSEGIAVSVASDGLWFLFEP